MRKLAALESRVRENRLHGSEGGVAKAIPTPIMDELVEGDLGLG